MSNPAVFENQELMAKRREAIKISDLRKRKIRAVNGWVLIRKVEAKDKESAGGVLLLASSRSQTGIVVSSGAPDFVKEGDEVIFTNFPIELEDLEEITGDKSLKLVRVEEIYGIVEPAEKGEPALIDFCESKDAPRT